MFHSTGAAMAKSHLPITFLGWTEEADSLFPQVRLPDLIKDDKLGGYEN